MSNVVAINRGDSVSLQLTWTDDEGAPLDMTAAAVELVDVAPAAMGLAAITPRPGGLVDLLLPAIHASKLPLGRLTRFRMRALFPGGYAITTPYVWIEVQ